MEYEKSEKTGYILEIERTPTGRNETVRKFAAMRAAMSWPRFELNLNGYFCILGEEAVGVPHFQGKERRRGMVRLLHEWEAPDIYTSRDVLFTNLIGAATRYKFEVVYGETEKLFGEDFRERVKMFQTFVYNKESNLHLYLQQPPSADDLDTSIMIVNSWLHRGLLDIPEKSILHEQLKSMKTTDLKDLRNKLCAVNALRLAIAGFEADPPPDPSQRNWRKNLREGSWKAY